LAPKVAEYIKLDKTSFGVVERTVDEVIRKTSIRRDPKTAKRLPFVTSDGPVGQPDVEDELDGIFND